MILFCRPAADENFIFSAGESASSNEDDDEPVEPVRVKRRTRQGWSVEEIKELEFYFQDFIKNKLTPSHKDVARIKKGIKSGCLLKRRDDLIVKKLSAMKMKKIKYANRK